MASKKPATSAKTAAAELKGGTSNSVAVVTSSPAISAALPSGFKLKRIVTVPSLVLKQVGAGRALLIVDAIRISKVVDKEEKGKPKREPANVCTVTDISTSEQFIFLVPAVVKANLERDYPNEGYVGKVFYIQNLGKRTESQRYYDFGIAEVEVELEEAE